jgi:hypothetical protein
VRRHRETGRQLWHAFADATRDILRSNGSVSAEHPVWSERPYAVFLYSPADVHRVIEYINANPQKEKLPPQRWPFVVPYDGWPHSAKS